MLGQVAEESRRSLVSNEVSRLDVQSPQKKPRENADTNIVNWCFAAGFAINGNRSYANTKQTMCDLDRLPYRILA